MFYQYDVTDDVILIEQAVTMRCYFLLLKYVKLTVVIQPYGILKRLYDTGQLTEVLENLKFC